MSQASGVGSVVGSVARPRSRRWGRQLAYAVTDLPVLLLALLCLPVLLVVVLVLAVTVVGLPTGLRWLLAASRAFGELDRRRLTRLLGLPVAASAPAPPAGPLGAVLSDGAGWRSLLHLLLRLPVGLTGHLAGLTAAAAGAAGLSYPLWYRTQYSCTVGGRCGPGMTVPGLEDTLSGPVAVTAVALLGAVLLVLARVLLWVTVTLSGQLAAALLAPSAQEQRLRTVEASRREVVQAEVIRLRRVERDLHDGVQARLVAIGLDLDQARHVLTAEDATRAQREVALQALATAHRQVREANDELRAVVRGIAPPALEAGLGTALESLAGATRTPVELAVDEDLGLLPPATESVLYFACAELLTNASKHSGATRVRVGLRRSRDQVVLRVDDDGSGGAVAVPDGGLAGLRGRLRGVDGELGLTSPRGGPTRVTVRIPVGGPDGAGARG